MRISDWSSDVCSSDLQILIERRFILQIHFRSATRRLVERRLRNEEMPVLDDLRHLPIKESEEQRANVGAVDVCVGHAHALVIAPLLSVEIVAASRAHCLHERAYLL